MAGFGCRAAAVLRRQRPSIGHGINSKRPSKRSLSNSSIITTRFAPSPTGPLHLGHAYSALLAYDQIQSSAGGRFLLRIEDIDQSRARPKWEAQIYDDLSWLGLKWETPVLRQSERESVYDKALDALWERGLLYPCSCSRSDIKAALSAPQETMLGPDGMVYPGTCRPTRHPDGPRPCNNVALRLNMEMACEHLEGLHLSFLEETTNRRIPVRPEQMIHTAGDVVLARRGMGTSYHLAVVLDDAAQQVTLVVRGADLADATQIHVVLYHLLSLHKQLPSYHHHRLIRDEDTGKRLAKRDDARAISLFRKEGASLEDIRAMVGL